MELKLFIVGIVCTILGYFINRILVQNDDAIDKNTEANIHLQLAVVELKVEVKNLAEKLAPIPKMQEDIAHLHELRRHLEIKTGKKSNGV